MPMSSAGFTPLAPIAGEAVPPGEADAIGVILGVIENQIRDSAKTGLARRDAHAKADGLVRAEFRVLDDLPAHLRVGVFAEPRTYDAWIRFSSSSGTPQPDSKLDGRGMAIKLMGVSASPSTTQDFVMINNPVFMVRNAIDYVDLQTKGLFYFFFPSLNPLRWRLHELMVTIAIFTNKALNPLNLRYWSMTPYRLGGDTACKFSARPVAPLSPFTQKTTPDFLRDNMAAQLDKAPATFDFMVQFRSDPASMPVEDPTVQWSETKSPFVPLARITIPLQTFTTPAQDNFCENLSFSPWHCVDEHRPLGGINRVRRIVYVHISALRHALNRAPQGEPKDFSLTL
jgi:hypothetical protein